MKKLLFAMLVGACSAVWAAPKDVYDIKPEAAKPAEALSSVDWENKNDAALKAATADETLAAFVADEAAAKALLAQVKPAYATDPLVACQVAAVTQWVMADDPWYCLLWDGPRAAGRKVWIRALLATVKGAQDDYVKSFCHDQLRWCGCPCCARCIAEIAAQEKSKAVRDFAEVVVRELRGEVVGGSKVRQ